MNSRIQNIIKELTKQDKKTLSQKALKVCEEAGELAKAVLPFDGAHATTHRFVDKEKILEEVVDCYLTSISIAYSLDFTDDDIVDMIDLKIKKWADIQAKAELVNEKLPYEIHVTVKDVDKQVFKKVCDELGVKPIILHLQANSDSLWFDDVMTSSVHMGDNRSVMNELDRISIGLIEAGITVVREKIETVPWHPAAPSTKYINSFMPDNCYFESHIPIHCKESDFEILHDIAIQNKAHLSKNIYKKIDDGVIMMMTLRSYDGTYETFQCQLMALLEQIKTKQFIYGKVVTEFAIYDTKVSHDSKWLN